MTPLVSVVIPNYNYARFLPDAIASVAAQSYPNLEMIVVDDASTDDSLRVLDILRAQYADRFDGRYFVEPQTENSGAHAALNAGIHMARGDYVAILNADDLFEPDRIARMHDAAAATGARLLFSDVQCIGPDGADLHSEFADKLRSLPRSVQQHPYVAVAAVAENVAVSTGNMFMSRTLHAELGGFRAFQYVHDYDYLLRASLQSEPAYVPGTNYLYRIHGDNTYTKLQDIGIAENRLVWLDAYGRIKRGNISHLELLNAPHHVELFRAAADAYGWQKRIMWRIAGTWMGSAVAAIMRRKLIRTAARQTEPPGEQQKTPQ